MAMMRPKMATLDRSADEERERTLLPLNSFKLASGIGFLQ